MAENDNKQPATKTPSFNAAARRPSKLKILPASPEVNIAIVNDVRRDPNMNPVERASPEVADAIQKMLDQFRADVPGAIPEARWMAAETRIYIVPGNANVNMTSCTEISKDGQHALNAIIITQGALDKMGKEPFKALLAHEFAHHLFAMDPALLDNPRYMPKSQAYKDEIAVMNFTPTGEELNAFKENFAKEHQGREPDRKETMAFIIETSNSRRAMYKEEVMADKVGLRLSKDVYAAQVEQMVMAETAGDLTRDNLEHPHENANQANRGNWDPHASVNVRWQENLQTVEDMNKEAGKTVVPPPAARPPGRPPGTKAPSSSPGT